MSPSPLLRWLLAATLVSAAAGCGSDGGPHDGSSGALSGVESSSLTRMREEEKLARDVYTLLEPQASVFSTIASSEQRHMDAVGRLLESHDLPDPSVGKSAGEFADDSLRAAYQDLIGRGQGSTADALSVGVEIEDMDILDLMTAEKDIDHADVSNVYGNLERASRNHLRTFCSELRAAGGVCTPHHLDPATFQSIVDSPIETGGPQGF